jgi:hydrogenase nickel incorporation protein HypA/HybF
MHELSLCRSIVEISLRYARGRPVAVVRVKIGHLRQVVPATLQSCFAIVVAETELAGAVLEVLEVPAEVRCRDCGRVTMLDRFELRCGECGGNDLEVVAGEEFFVESLEIVE